MTLKIVKIGNPILRRKARPVPAHLFRTPSLRRFIRNMVSTMRRAQGVGLAANQVAQGRRVMVMECRGNRRYPKAASFPLRAYFNIRIVHRSKRKVKGWEGCLSIPGFRGLVPRSQRVTFRAVTPDGSKVEKTVSGFEARVVQHEVDHLNGLFYVDRMDGFKSWTHLEEFNRRLRFKIRDRRS